VVKMGVDGSMLLGNGIMINPLYLDPSTVDYLVFLIDKYPDLFSSEVYEDPRSWAIMVWAEEPKDIKTSYNRRPLIIDSSQILSSMRPTQDGMDLNIQDASYKQFIVRLDDVDQQEIANRAISRILDTYDEDGNYIGKGSLEQDEKMFLLDLLVDAKHSLAGKYLMYVLS